MATPFAYGIEDNFLTSTAGREVFVCVSRGEAPAIVHAMDGNVRGVRNCGDEVLAIDDTGALVALDASGRVRWRCATGVEPLQLAMHLGTRTWAVLHGGGVIQGTGDRLGPSIDEPGLIAIAYDSAGALARLAVRTLGLPDGSRIEIPHDADSVSWSRLGYWLVATTAGIYRIRPGSEPLLYLKWNGADRPTGVVASESGQLCAFASGSKHAVVFGVERDINCGAVAYFDRTVGELEWGPDTWLGIGLGDSDGNKIDVFRGGTYRTDPVQGRTRNRWMVQPGTDREAIGKVLGRPVPTDADAAPTSDVARSDRSPMKLGVVVAVVAMLALLIWKLVA